MYSISLKIKLFKAGFKGLFWGGPAFYAVFHSSAPHLFMFASAAEQWQTSSDPC